MSTSNTETAEKPLDFVFQQWKYQSKSYETPRYTPPNTAYIPTLYRSESFNPLNYEFLNAGSFAMRGDEEQLITGAWRELTEDRVVARNEIIRRKKKQIKTEDNTILNISSCFTPCEQGYVYLDTGEQTRNGDQYHSLGKWWNILCSFRVSVKNSIRRKIT